MSIRRFSLHWWLAAVAVTVLFVFLGYFALRGIKQSIFERKTLRETTATVKGKEYVRFDEMNPSYMDEDGHRIPLRQGDEQWRVYFKIDNFDRLDEPLRTHLSRAEEERVVAGRLRFEINSKEWYEKIEAGDKLIIRYQWLGGDVILVVNVENPKYPNLQ